MWSLGCIIGELIRFSNITKNYGPLSNMMNEQRYLFPGTSCFPNSPCQEMLENGHHIISETDQMLVILETIGAVSE